MRYGMIGALEYEACRPVASRCPTRLAVRTTRGPRILFSLNRLIPTYHRSFVSSLHSPKLESNTVDASNSIPPAATSNAAMCAQAPLDSTAYPHILQRVVDLAPLETLIAFRGISRAIRDRIDAELFAHVGLVTVRPRYVGAKTGVGFTDPATGRLLPCIPSVRQLPRPGQGGESSSSGAPTPTDREGDDELHPRTQSAAHLASNRRIMTHIRVVDSATDKLYDMPTLPPLEVMRKCTPTAAGLPAYTVVDSVYLNPPTDTQPSIARSYIMTRTGAVYSSIDGGPGMPPMPRMDLDEELERTRDDLEKQGETTFVAHLTWAPGSTMPPHRGIMLALSRHRFQHVVIVLPTPREGCTWDMNAVVRGVNLSAKMLLMTRTRVTIVGIERFGPHHFGAVDAGGDPEMVQEAAKKAIVRQGRLFVAQGLTCMSWDEWVAGRRPEVALLPP